eukprot:RCo033803
MMQSPFRFFFAFRYTKARQTYRFSRGFSTAIAGVLPRILPAFVDADSFPPEQLLQLDSAIRGSVGIGGRYFLYSSTPGFGVEPAVSAALGPVEVRVVSTEGTGLAQPNVWQLYCDVTALVCSSNTPASVGLVSNTDQLNMLARFLHAKGLTVVAAGSPSLEKQSSVVLQSKPSSSPVQGSGPDPPSPAAPLTSGTGAGVRPWLVFVDGQSVPKERLAEVLRQHLVPEGSEVEYYELDPKRTLGALPTAGYEHVTAVGCVSDVDVRARCVVIFPKKNLSLGKPKVLCLSDRGVFRDVEEILREGRVDVRTARVEKEADEKKKEPAPEPSPVLPAAESTGGVGTTADDVEDVMKEQAAVSVSEEVAADPWTAKLKAEVAKAPANYPGRDKLTALVTEALKEASPQLLSTVTEYVSMAGGKDFYLNCRKHHGGSASAMIAGLPGVEVFSKHRVVWCRLKSTSRTAEN